MKTTIENHEQILEKLNKLNFIDKQDNSLISEEGFTLRWDFKFSALEIMPVQLLIRVLYNDAYVLTWGCTDQKDTYDFARFIQLAVTELFNKQYNATSAKEREAKAQFDNL